MAIVMAIANPQIRPPENKKPLPSDAVVLPVEVSAEQPRMPTNHETYGTGGAGRSYLIGACFYQMGI